MKPNNAISVPEATAIGPYSQAVRAGDFIFISGQTPIDPTTGTLVNGTVAEQTAQCLGILAAILRAAGLGFDDVVKCTVFLVDMGDFPSMNDVYARYFQKPFPARTTIGVAALPLGARIEIDMIAKMPTDEAKHLP